MGGLRVSWTSVRELSEAENSPTGRDERSDTSHALRRAAQGLYLVPVTTGDF